MGWVWIALLVLAVAILVAAEWPRLTRGRSLSTKQLRPRRRRKTHLRVIEPDADPDTDEFAASVERDLARLPTTRDRD